MASSPIVEDSPIFDELCQEQQNAGVTHPLADRVDQHTAPEAVEQNGTSPQTRARPDRVTDSADDGTPSADAESRWAVPDEKVA